MRPPSSTAAEAEVGDERVVVEPDRPSALADEPGGGGDVANAVEEHSDAEVGDGLGVAPRGAEHDPAELGGGGDVDVHRLPPRRGDDPERGRGLEHVAGDELRLDDDGVEATGDDPPGELVGGVHPAVVVPRLVDHLRDAPEPLELGGVEGGEDEDLHGGRG